MAGTKHISDRMDQAAQRPPALGSPLKDKIAWRPLVQVAPIARLSDAVQIKDLVTQSRTGIQPG